MKVIKIYSSLQRMNSYLYVDLHFTREKRDCQQFFLEKNHFSFFTKEQLTNFRLYVILFLVHEICTIFQKELWRLLVAV